MVEELTGDLVGKDVETADGQHVGTVSEVEGERFYVNFTDTEEMEKERQQEIHADDVEEVSGDTIVIVRST